MFSGAPDVGVDLHHGQGENGSKDQDSPSAVPWGKNGNVTAQEAACQGWGHQPRGLSTVPWAA